MFTVKNNQLATPKSSKNSVQRNHTHRFYSSSKSSLLKEVVTGLMKAILQIWSNDLASNEREYTVSVHFNFMLSSGHTERECYGSSPIHAATPGGQNTETEQ